MMIPVEHMADIQFNPWPCPEGELMDTEYYMTAPDFPGKAAHKIGMVKLGVKVKHTTGQMYGNIIEIPLVELKRLMAEVDHG
jgi:hypothetical protein